VTLREIHRAIQFASTGKLIGVVGMVGLASCRTMSEDYPLVEFTPEPIRDLAFDNIKSLPERPTCIKPDMFIWGKRPEIWSRDDNANSFTWSESWTYVRLSDGIHLRVTTTSLNPTQSEVNHEIHEILKRFDKMHPSGSLKRG
jgi:hypothetical protein